MKSFHDYASLKTTGQLVMDLGSISTHICALVALLRQYDVNKNLSTQVLLWVLVGTIIFQVRQFTTLSLPSITTLLSISVSGRDNDVCMYFGGTRDWDTKAVSVSLCISYEFAYKWHIEYWFRSTLAKLIKILIKFTLFR